MKKKILIVDDDSNLRKAMQEFLEMEAFITVEAKNGKEAIEKCTSETPHLVLLDIFLPGELGLDVAVSISNKFKEKRPKIIAISGTLGGGQYVINSKKFNAYNKIDLFLKKPFELEELLKQINHLLN